MAYVGFIGVLQLEASTLAMASNGISISAGNQGPLLNICNWIFLVITCIACSLKVISKWIMIHKVQVDDAYMTAAMVGISVDEKVFGHSNRI